MPILDIEIVGDASSFRDDLAQRLADAAGTALQSRPQGTWVKLHFLSAARYAENEGADQGYPMIVSVIQAEVPTSDALRLQVSRLAKALSEAADHPLDNVHIVVEPAASGRIAFGGKLIE